MQQYFENASNYLSQSVKCVLHRIKFQFIKSIDRNSLARASSVYLGFWVFWEWMCVLHSNWSFNFYFWNIYAAHRLFLSSQHLILNFSFLCIKCIFHFSRRLGIVFYFLTHLWICSHSLALFFLLIHVKMFYKQQKEIINSIFRCHSTFVAQISCEYLWKIKGVGIKWTE